MLLGSTSQSLMPGHYGWDLILPFTDRYQYGAENVKALGKLFSGSRHKSKACFRITGTKVLNYISVSVVMKLSGSY